MTALAIRQTGFDAEIVDADDDMDLDALLSMRAQAGTEVAR